MVRHSFLMVDSKLSGERSVFLDNKTPQSFAKDWYAR